MASLPQPPERSKLKPVIDEIIRTQHCENPLKLLLDKIHIVVTNTQHSDEDAYRIWLSDGTKMIQAVLMPDLHPFLTAGEVREGSLITVTKYKLVQAAKYQSQGWVWILVILDMDLSGHDGRDATEMELEIRGDAQTSSGGIYTTDDAVSATSKSLGKGGQLASPQKRKFNDSVLKSPSYKSKTTDSRISPSPMKAQTGSALCKLDAKNPFQTPTKSFKFEDRLGSESPQRH